LTQSSQQNYTDSTAAPLLQRPVQLLYSRISVGRHYQIRWTLSAAESIFLS